MKNHLKTLGCVAVLGILLGVLSAPAARAGLSGTPAAPGRFGSQEAQADLMLKAPYLMYPDTLGEMEVLWQLTATATSTIEWGTDTNYGAGSAQSLEYGYDHQHAYFIHGLTSGTKYYYRITTEGVAYTGSFTAAPDGRASRLKFFAYGDTRSYPNIHEQVAGAMVSAYTVDPEFQTFVVFVGDYVYNGATESYWTNEFFSPSYPSIRQMVANLPYQGCMGNHETYPTGNSSLFPKYFPYPFVADRYWSFDYGPAHFAVVDQYSDWAPGSAQLQWLANDLASTYKDWKFVILHEPGWSAAGSGGHANNPFVQSNIQPLCEQYGVSIVFAGHNHYYARAVVNGVQHITTGGGGAPLITPAAGQPNVVATAKSYHFCRVFIDGATLGFKAVNQGGVMLDTFTIQKPLAVENLPTVASLATARPNPFRSETVIECRLAEGARGSLVIHDVAGRVVRSFPLAAPGRHSLTWDGTDDAGRPVQPGLYFYRVESSSGSPGGSGAGKLLLLR